LAERSPSQRVSPPPFVPIDQQRAHEYVAEQIRRQIGLGLLAPRQALPNERELASSFGVGRATVQQAVRLLEAERLVETRRGRHGGTFVTQHSDDGLAMDYLLARLRRERARVVSALDFRKVVEPEVAALAAAVSDRELIVEAREAASRAERAESDSDFMGADTEFHLALANATENEFLVEAIERIRLVLNDALLALPGSALWHERSVRDHEEILAGVEGRDADRAAAALTSKGPTPVFGSCSTGSMPAGPRVDRHQ
jgi:GntR family transcriptional regulator, transcriptional repressor for pyruvate dehydrogenase complex